MHLEEIGENHLTPFMQVAGSFKATESLIFPESAGGTPAWFKKQIKLFERERLDWRPGPGKFSLTRYLMLDGAGVVHAFGLMRFPLDDVSESDGGNLVCEVPPNLRGKGWGSVCLSLLLFEAVRAGMRRVLVTSPAEDLAARKMIENNRGVLWDVEKSKKGDRKGADIARYWISFR